MNWDKGWKDSARDYHAQRGESRAVIKTQDAFAPIPTPPPPLQFLDATAWHGQPVPNRQWCVLNRVPLRNVTLLSGDGGVGKSIVALQLAAAVVLDGRDWLGGNIPAHGHAMGLACEDDEDELHFRLSDVVAHYGASFADLKNLHLKSLAGEDALLAAPDRSGLIKPTELFHSLKQSALEIRPRLIVLDNSADIFGGSENDRAQVRQFIALLRGLAISADAAVLLTSHPSLKGQESGSGYSGTTAWHASVRSRMYMKRATTERDEEPDPSLRVIEIMKANYGPVGEIVNVRWQDGIFARIAAMGTLDKLAADQRAEDLFLKLLAQLTEQGRNVSHAPTANNYAPNLFAKHPDGKGKKKELGAAMERLFAAGKIRVEEYDRRGSKRIERCEVSA